MNTFLTLPEAERSAIFTDVANKIGIPPYYVEKDFWVTWMLGILFNDDAELSPYITFRGGTSLSKAYKAISRFSEDIDLSISRKWLGVTEINDPALAETKSQAEKRHRKIRKLTRAKLNESVLPHIQNAVESSPLNTSDFRIEPEGESTPFDQSRDPYCIYFTYPTTVQSSTSGYISSRVKLEFSARAEGAPEETKPIQCFVADYYQDIFEQAQISVRTILPARTFWEKLFIIHEENTAPESRQPKPRLSRHYYDLYQIVQNNLASPEPKLFEEVRDHRKHYFAQNWVNYEDLTISKFQVIPPERLSSVWSADYKDMSVMVYEEMPPLEVIFSSITDYINSV